MKGIPWWATAALGLIGGWAGLVAYIWKWVLANEEKVIDWAIAKMEENEAVHSWLSKQENIDRLNELADKGLARLKADIAIKPNEPKVS